MPKEIRTEIRAQLTLDSNQHISIEIGRHACSIVVRAQQRLAILRLVHAQQQPVTLGEPSDPAQHARNSGGIAGSKFPMLDPI